MESNIDCYLRPPATINLCVDHVPDCYGQQPQVTIDSIARLEILDIILPLTDLIINIQSCQIELIEAATDKGQVLRAYRIIGIDGLSAKEYGNDDYPIFLRAHNYIKGILSVDDGRAYYRYIVDRWYEDADQRAVDDTYEAPPDVIPALAMASAPSVRDGEAANMGRYCVPRAMYGVLGL